MKNRGRHSVGFISMIFFIAVIYSSCTLFEPASPVASYIHIDSIQLTTNYQVQGSISSKISDAWIIYDGKYLGTFPLPADIPLIGEGLHKLEILGGISQNGIAGDRAAYP